MIFFSLGGGGGGGSIAFVNFIIHVDHTEKDSPSLQVIKSMEC